MSEASLNPAALERLREWGGEKLVSQMVRLFLTNAPTRMSQIRDGANGADAKEVEKGSHSLKSSAANLGAMRVHELCAAIEDAAEAGEVERIRSLLPDLEAAYEAVIQELQEVVKGLPE